MGNMRFKRLHWNSRTVPILLLTLLLYACSRDPGLTLNADSADCEVAVPSHFPAILYPADNKPTKDRIALGKALFYEPQFSKNGNISCASCHLPSFSFADTARFSKGTDGILLKRNSPSLANVAWQPYLLREGSVPDLERQILVPIQEAHEFNNNILSIVALLKDDPYYHTMALKAYGRAFDAWVLTRALSCFERTLISGHSPYDRWLKGDQKAMTDLAKAGMALFYDTLNCGSCHAGVFQTHFGFANNGLYEKYEDPGRQRFTRKPEDAGLFKIPSLRNVAVTASYMHDGSLTDLRSVIDHYSSGGKPHPNKHEAIQPFKISELQKTQLTAFLESLTDREMMENGCYKP